MSKKTIQILLYLLPLPVLFISLFIGPSGSISAQDIFHFLRNIPVSDGATDHSLVYSIVIDTRLPRVILAFLVGAALAVSGGSMQAIFKNPLTDPYVLGLSSGAAFGAALSLAYHFLPVQVSAFIFGALAVLLSYLTAAKRNYVSMVALILSGIIFSGIFTALLTIVQYLTDPFKLQSIVYWTMGNMHNASWSKVQAAIIPIVISVFIMLLFRWQLNTLALGDEEAKTSGINPVRSKIIILLAATLASSASVSVAGVIGLYGLMVPHMLRMMLGPDNKILLPLNFVFGGTLLVIIDNFSRAFANFEIPIGVFTMLVGAPFFIYLIKKNNTGWNP